MGAWYGELLCTNFYGVYLQKNFLLFTVCYKYTYLILSYCRVLTLVMNII